MKGYNELAALMAAFSGLAIFRRFLALNIRDLLITQGELVHLEANLKRTVDQDHASGDRERVNLQFDIEALLDSAEDPEKNNQWERTVEIRTKLKEHRKF